MCCTGPTRAAKEELKSLVPARQAQETNTGRFHMYSLSPHLLQFQQLVLIYFEPFT
jgi:hypothetical protein